MDLLAVQTTLFQILSYIGQQTLSHKAKKKKKTLYSCLMKTLYTPPNQLKTVVLSPSSNSFKLILMRQ